MSHFQCWTDARKPSPGDPINREDGRVCRVKEYKTLMAVNPTSNTGMRIRAGELGALELPPTQAGSSFAYPPVVTLCGEELSVRIVSMNAFWPMVTTCAVTCLKCLAQEFKA